MTTRLRIAALALILAALTVVPAGRDLRAHSPGGATLTALTVTAEGAAQTLFPRFSRTVRHYVVPVADGVTQITIAARPDGDATVVYAEADGTEIPDADTTTDGMQVDIPAEGKRINVEVTHDDAGAVIEETYGVLVIREGPAVPDTIALIALYNSTDGDNWTFNENWGSTLPLDDWYNVNTDADGRVTYLAFWDNNLRGTLPDELGDLDQMTELPLQDNHLTGSIPDLGRLTNLTLLRMWNNQLTGDIPRSLSNLTKLRTLELWDNQLTGPIPDLSRLTDLTFLDLHDNQLSGTIPSMSGLTNLREVRLNENQLSGPIPDLSGLTSLERLWLEDNQLSGEIPASLDGLTSLLNLYLDQNQLTGEIPASLGNFTKLTQLFLGGNQLTGTIPDSLGNLTTLRQLGLNSNQLTGKIPASLGNLTELLYLYLSENQLEGPIPDLSGLTNLLDLYLWGNRLSGPIPDWLGNLTDLQQLILSQNQLSGEIPDSLRNLGNLYYLYLNNNQLSGEIPRSLGDLTNLYYLYLYDNQLSGEIPRSLDNLANLQQLLLNQNQLTGPIPDLSRLTGLTHLALATNQLDGSIPDWVASLTALQQLALGGNQLTGAIPPILGSLTSLNVLSLEKNQLSGEIPPALGDLRTLKFARLAGNTDADGNPSLTGCVPHGLRYLVAAVQVDSDVPVHDFIGVDANGDRDTDDPDDIPGLNLPFCMVSALTLSDVPLAPAFAGGTAAYTAEVFNEVQSTTVTATLNDDGDTVTIMTGRDRYTSGDAVPLDVGLNEISITVTPPDAALLSQTFTVRVLREGSVESDRAALMALYNSAGGSGWTDKTNWDSTEPLTNWFGVTVLSNGRVEGLDLSANNLRGTLPAELGSLTTLNELDLSENQLRGTIPDWRGLTLLAILNLGDNQLSGPIPDWLGSLTLLHELYLRDNRLTGTIPEELGDLGALRYLYLDDNQLSGAIPEWPGEISQLQQLYLNGNQLSGCVPDRWRDFLLTNHDFIALDANGDGDAADPGDTPGLPFCTLSSLAFSDDVTLNPEFTGSTTTYTASAPHDVALMVVTATLHDRDGADTITITKGADPPGTPLAGGAVVVSVPLDVGPNVLTLTATPAVDPLTPYIYTVTVTRAPNAPPVFDEGAAATRGVAENTAAGENIGDPVAATDADNDPLQYSLDAAGAEFFDIDASSGQLRTKAGLDYETRDSYRVPVSVSDGVDANGDPDETTDNTIAVTILVSNVNEAPEFPAAADSRIIPEDTPVGGDVGAPFMASDGDNDTLTYSLGSSTDADSFSIDAASGQLRTRVALDYEEGSTSYTVTVTAADPSNAAASVVVTISVTNADEAGTVTLSKVQPIVDRDLMAEVTDPDYVAGNPTWSWESSSNRSSWTPIDGADTEYYRPVAGDVGRYLRATVSYDDDEGAGKSASAVSLNRVRMAASSNTDPQFPSAVTGNRAVDENTPAGEDIGEPVEATDADDDTLTYTLDEDGAEFFGVVATTGQLQTKAALDFETAGFYYVRVIATDTAGGTAETAQITINVNNVEEPGTVTLSSRQPIVGQALTATVSDPDDISDIDDIAWRWERSSNQTNWTPIGGATADTYTPATGDMGYYLRATASYTDEQGPAKSAQAISANAVAVGPGRNAPVLREHPNATRSIARNTAAGRDIGAPFAATDADNDALTYSLGGPDWDAFDIDASSGQLLTKVLLTGITRTSYTVFVSVSDGKDDEGMPEVAPQIDATTEVTITVTAPRRGGGGGGGGFGGPILTVTTAVAGEAPAGLSFVFAYTCANTRGELLSTRTFTVAAGRTFGLLIAAGLSCSLAVTDDGGASAVDGLFTDVVILPAGYKTTVTFTFGPAPTAVDPTTETVVEEAGVSLTIPPGSRDAPYSVLLETDPARCEGALDLDGESLTCYTVTVFDAEGEEEEASVELLVPATITLTLDAVRIEELGGIEGVRAARERGELRMLQRDDAESPWQELPFTIEETADGAVVIVVSVSAFSDFSLVTAPPRLQVLPLHADWTVVVWDGADGASVVDALGGLGASAGGSDVSAQVGVVYHWVAETQTWGSFRPGVPAFLNGFDTFERGASYWVRSSEAVEWTVVGGPLEPPAAEPTRLHTGWTEVVWRGADGAAIAEAFSADVFPQVEVIYRWLAETQTWGSFRPGAPAFLSAFDTFASGASYWIAVAEGVEWVVGPDGG